MKTEHPVRMITIDANADGVIALVIGVITSDNYRRLRDNRNRACSILAALRRYACTVDTAK